MYDTTLRPFIAWCVEQGVEYVQQMDTRTIRQYIRYSQQRSSNGRQEHLASKTVHGYYLCISSWMGWCTEEYQLPTNPCTRVEAPKLEEKVLTIFTTEQILEMIRACKDCEWEPVGARDTAIISLFADTGIRLSEMASLTLGSINLEGNDPYIRVEGKGRKQREVGLGKQSRRALEVYLRYHRSQFKNADTSQLAFLTRVGQKMKEVSFYVVMKRLKERTGITDVRVSAHTFRHTFAINYLMQHGADIYKLARLMGHNRVATTEIYLRAFEARQARDGASVLDVMSKKRR
jgi:site-specific recombinase XerD